MPRINVNILELRKRRGWTQAELAERVGVSQATVSSWERDVQPSAGSTYKLAQALGCAMEDLFTTPDPDQTSGDDPDSAT
jgi:transcriptional regulator with XRE-family HTH domain